MAATTGTFGFKRGVTIGTEFKVLSDRPPTVGTSGSKECKVPEGTTEVFEGKPEIKPLKGLLFKTGRAKEFAADRCLALLAGGPPTPDTHAHCPSIRVIKALHFSPNPLLWRQKVHFLSLLPPSSLICHREMN